MQLNIIGLMILVYRIRVVVRIIFFTPSQIKRNTHIIIMMIIYIITTHISMETHLRKHLEHETMSRL